MPGDCFIEKSMGGGGFCCIGIMENSLGQPGNILLENMGRRPVAHGAAAHFGDPFIHAPELLHMELSAQRPRGRWRISEDRREYYF